MQDLLAREQLPDAYATIVDRFWRPLAAQLAARARAATRPLIVGVNGAQGSGKSTLCMFLEALLAQHGLRAATLSLDDLYLTRARRLGLSVTVHPLLATRGVPGTHDLELADRVITALTGSSGPVAVPRFDKGLDDRHPPALWTPVAAPLDILLFEGWCIGATPQAKSELATPINRLEAEDDPDAAWRKHVNASLATGYAPLFRRLDILIAFCAPAFEAVRDWRFEQEAKLRAARGAGAGMDEARLDRFLQHFERLTRHMLATLPATADIVVELDQNRTIGAMRGV